jgi:phage gp46-like protein
MADIKTVWDVKNGRGDYVIVDGALADGDELVTSVLISLFTDRRAQPSDIIPDGTKDPRGWWADNGTDGNTDEWGSRLWLLDRKKSPTAQTLNDATNYCNEALVWLVNDGVAVRVDVLCQWNDTNFLAIHVTIFKTDGTKPITMRFQLLWNEV